MKWTTPISLAVVLFATVGAGQAGPPPSREQRQAIAEHHIKVITALDSAVREIYPTKLLDTSAWRMVCDSAKASERKLVDTPETFLDFRLMLDDLFQRHGGSEAGVKFYHYLEGEPQLQFEILECESPVWLHIAGDGLARIEYANCAYPFDRVLPTDEKLDSARQTRGLILDLRHGTELDFSMARQIAGRFIQQPMPCVRARIRECGTTRYRDTLYTVEPRGAWPYSRPLVVLTSEESSWATYLLTNVLRSRSDVRLVGKPLPAPRGILPVEVELAAGTVVRIPTAIPLQPDGDAMEAMATDVYVSDYGRAASDSLLARAWQELRRIVRP